MVDEERKTSNPDDEPGSPPLTGVVVARATAPPAARGELAVRVRERLAELSRNPAVVATAAVGATVVAEAVAAVARRAVRGSSSSVEIRGTVVQHVHVVHHHVVHVVDAGIRRALPPA